MTILGIFLNNEIRTGGHRRYLELMEDLAARGHQVVVALNRSLYYVPVHFKALPLDARYIHKGFPPASLIFSRAVRQQSGAIEDAIGKPDWILIHGETHLSAAILLKKRFGCRLLFGVRSNVVRWSAISMRENLHKPVALLTSLKEQLVYRRYEIMVARFADVAVFQSSYDRDDFLGRVQKTSARPVVIGGNIGGPRFKPEYAGSNRSIKLKKLVFVGTLGERKGLRYLIEALSLLSQRGIGDLELDVLGPGENRAEYEQMIMRTSLSGKVHFHGRVADPFPFYRDADLMVVPSLFDSYPDTVLEALHVGVPVIASRVGGIPDQLVHEELLFPIRDANAIAVEIAQMHGDQGYYMHVRQLCAERRAAFEFDWAERWERAMLEHLSDGGAKA